MIAIAKTTPAAQAQQTPSEPQASAPESQDAPVGVSPYPLALESIDMRRSLHREHAETIVARASVLPPQERALLESVYEEGMTVARLAGLRNECPRALRRRLRRLIARVLSPRYAFVMSARAGWTPARRKIATDVVLHGRSMRRSAEALGYTFHTVRKEMQSVDALFEASLSFGRERG